MALVLAVQRVNGQPNSAAQVVGTTWQQPEAPVATVAEPHGHTKTRRRKREGRKLNQRLQLQVPLSKPPSPFWVQASPADPTFLQEAKVRQHDVDETSQSLARMGRHAIIEPAIWTGRGSDGPTDATHTSAGVAITAKCHLDLWERPLARSSCAKGRVVAAQWRSAHLGLVVVLLRLPYLW